MSIPRSVCSVPLYSVRKQKKENQQNRKTCPDTSRLLLKCKPLCTTELNEWLRLCLHSFVSTSHFVECYSQETLKIKDK